MHEARFRYMRRAPDNDLFHVIDELRTRSMLPAIYFIFSRRGCAEALGRCAVHGLDLTDRAEKEAIDARYGELVQRIEDTDERRVFRQAIDPSTLRNGVAMHHAGMLPSAKEAVERLFIEGLVKVVFATETLSLGLNMPARACVVSSFTKFDGTGFHSLTAGELTQLMGRAGRRGIDRVGHGVILKESDVDVRDIYDSAIGGEMSVDSKFAPTYTMVLSLLRTRSVERAEELLDKSFGQYQNVQRADHWTEKRHNLEEQLADLRRRVFRHPAGGLHRAHPHHPPQRRRVGRGVADVGAPRQARALARFAARPPRRARRRSRAALRGHAPRAAPAAAAPAQLALPQLPVLRRAPRPPRGDARHRGDARRAARRSWSGPGTATGASSARFAAVLHDAGFLEDDAPNELGLLAASLFGENALLIADAIVAGHLDPLTPAELAAALVTLVAEDRGRDRPQPSRRHFPTPRVEVAYRRLRGSLQRLGRAGARARPADPAPALARLHQRGAPMGVGDATRRHRDACRQRHR